MNWYREYQAEWKEIIEIAENLGLVLSNQEEIKSRYDYNKYVFKYDSLFSVISLEIIIETSYYQSVYPVEKHVVGSFVGRFCSERNIILPVPFYEPDYKNVTQKLLYEDISYDYAIENGIAIIAESDVFVYKK